MTKVGTIKNLRGFMRAQIANVSREGNLYYLHDDTLFNRTKYDLSSNLANVEYWTEQSKSASKLLSKAALTGVAAHSWKRGSGFFAGSLYTIADSLGESKTELIIKLTMMDGSVVTGSAKKDLINKLVRISPQLGEHDRSAFISEQQRMQRFLEDAPRTIVEVQRDIERIEQEINEDHVSAERAAKFDAREKFKADAQAKEKLLARKKDLYKKLSERIAAVEKFGSYDEYMKSYNTIEDDIAKYTKKTSTPTKSIAAIVLSIIVAVISDEHAFTSLAVLVTALLLPYCIFKLTISKKAVKKLDILKTDQANLITTS